VTYMLPFLIFLDWVSWLWASIRVAMPNKRWEW
jgi:hypothetical protein